MNKEKEPTNNELLKSYLELYLADNAYSHQDELEVKFGTKHYNQITKIDFDNIINKLKSLGFYQDGPDKYHLNIINEYADEKTGKMRDSNIRTTVIGLTNIQNYCRENNFRERDIQNLRFLQKFRKKTREGLIIKPIDFHDHHFRVNYKTERQLLSNRFEIENMLQNWTDRKKIFRFIKRFTFIHHDYPFKIDCSIVKTNRQKKLHNGRRVYIKEYSLEDANVFNEPENYEIELELNNMNSRSYNGDNLYKVLKKGIQIILSGWQESNFPIKYTEQETILREYMILLHGKDKLPQNNRGFSRKAHSGDFLGPSSISLETKNIISLDVDSAVPNINRHYTVTEKADGLRKLLYVNKTGKIYFIDMNMKVQFTGNKTPHRDCFNTIIDGEHVLYDKMGNFINLFLAFDIYYLNSENMKGYSFVEVPTTDGGESKEQKYTDKFRLAELYDYVKKIESVCVIRDYGNQINIKVKNFYTNIGISIFTQCKKILDGIKDGVMFEYETDGLIFTPCKNSVGSSKSGIITPSKKMRWDYSLKWKPSEFNTIDFLVKVKKTEQGDDFIGNIFIEGDNMTSVNKLNQYKTLVLHVGFDENKHGFINPFDDMVKGIYPKYSDNQRNNSYKAMPFIPYEFIPPYPLYLTNLMIKNVNGTKMLFTENGKEVFEDDMVVEFRWQKDAEKFWKWIPIRVRYDKTAQYRRQGKISCNAYTTAEGVWRSINNPVTEEMISTGLNIPEVVDNDVYYNRDTRETNTKSLRDFHNRFVKRKLILDVSKRGDTLIDMTVGMGGDLNKWIDAKLSFVFGLDISRDNIENRIQGACSRYLRAKKKYKSMPDALFVNGNSSLNINSGEAIMDEKGKKVLKALLGEGSRDEEALGKGVYKQFGIGKNGYNIVSNQFSIHYFFENTTTFYNFMRNVSENCKIGGYFIGTCYDGERVFNKLLSKKKGESIFILNDNGTKMWDIKKQYNSEVFQDDETSLGYKIDVHQESINKTFSEYLVNFEFLSKTLEHYGFVKLSAFEAKKLGFKKSINTFKSLFDLLEEDIKLRKIREKDIGTALNLSMKEKQISFLNNYFIFKKVRNVNAKEITRLKLNRTDEQKRFEESEETKLDEIAEPVKRVVKKYRKKLKLPIK